MHEKPSGHIEPEEAPDGEIKLTAPGPSGYSQTWVLIIATGIVLFVLLMVTIYLWGSPDVSQADRNFLILVLLAFALATVSSLLFVSRAELSGNMMGASVAIGGPAATWLIAVLLLVHFAPDDFLQEKKTRITLPELNVDLTHAEETLGWLRFAQWLNEDRGYESLLETNQSDTITSIETSMFGEPSEDDPPGGSDSLPKKVKVATLFIYSDTEILKLQRVQGESKNASSYIPFKSYGSTGENETRSFLFTGEELTSTTAQKSIRLTDDVFDSFSGKKSTRYYKINGKIVDCFILTWYRDKPLSDKDPNYRLRAAEDFAIVNMNKFSNEGRGDLVISVATIGSKLIAANQYDLNDKKNPTIWAVTRPLQFSGVRQSITSRFMKDKAITRREGIPENIPLSFSRIRVVPKTDDMSSTAKILMPWLEVIDMLIAGKANDYALTKKQRDTLTKALHAVDPTQGGESIKKFVSLVDSGVTQSLSEEIDAVLEYRIGNANNLILLMFKIGDANHTTLVADN